MANTNRAQVAMLAQRLWEDRGRPEGTPEADWQLAEELLDAGSRDNQVESFTPGHPGDALTWRMDDYPLFYHVESPADDSSNDDSSH